MHRAQKNRAKARFFYVCKNAELQLLFLHERIKLGFRELEPQVGVTTELGVIGVHLFPVGVLGVELFVESHRLFESSSHHVFRELAQLGA